MTIIDDLAAEQDRLEAVLEGLDDAAWTAPGVQAARSRPSTIAFATGDGPDPST
jgi:hypothetical protein